MSSKSDESMGFSEAFFDTSVLLDYALEQDDGSAKDVLKEHGSDNYTGATPEREFKEIKSRREKIVRSVLKCRNISNWEPPSDVDMSDNDRDWCAELLAELDQLATREKIEDQLEQEEQKMNRGYDRLFKNIDCLIEDVWPNELDAQLLASLTFIKNNNDKHVVCEAADWAASIESDNDNLITTDSDDLLSQKDRIVEQVDRNRDFDTLSILDPADYLSEDPSW